ncbi:MAG: DUF4139 domain-containing protein [Planctomycetota bacterium]|nr:DUF4139 domain-containing protein [Planctomycetota bacterium]
MSIEIGPDGAVVERAGTLPEGDERISDLPLAIDPHELSVLIEGLDTPPAIELTVSDMPPPEDPGPAWEQAYAARQAEFVAASAAAERAALRAQLARGVFGGVLGMDPDEEDDWDEAPTVYVPHATMPSPAVQDALQGFLQGQLQQAQREQAQAQQARDTARLALIELDQQRAAAHPAVLPRSELHLSGAGGRSVRVRYRVEDARWAPHYRLLVPARGPAQLVREAVIAVPAGYTWQTSDLILRTRAEARQSWLAPLRVSVLGLGTRADGDGESVSQGARSESVSDVTLDNFRRTQHADGSWGEPSQRILSTGLVAACYLAAGYEHRTPNQYRRTMKAALDYLAEAVDRSVSTAEAAWVTVALCEAYAMTNDPALVDAAQHALDRLGGRVFSARGLAVEVYREGAMMGPELVAYATMGFKSAKVAGFDVGTSLERMREDFLPRLLGHDQRHEAGISYLVSAIFLGMKADEGLREMVPINEWVESVPGWIRSGKLELPYLATLGTFQMGGEFWKAWSNGVRDPLLAVLWKGIDRGSLQAMAPHPSGEAVRQALLYLPNTVYYRYLPVAANQEGAVAARPRSALRMKPKPLADVGVAAHGWPLRYQLGASALQSGQRQVVEIDRLTLFGGVELYAVPSAKPGAWRRLGLSNPLAVPLPQGPMSISVNGELLADQVLNFLPPGATVVAELGREDRVRVVRTERRSSEDAWGKRREEVQIHYRVDGDLSAYESIRIVEPIPKPIDAAIHLRVLDPPWDVDELDRRLAEDPVWRLDVPLKTAPAEAAVVYELRHPLDRRPVLLSTDGK